ncbi:hypothetical protein DL98DRAFT_572900 [Cadophora sp. DSE1049]|nr:hypothetical protein DL98DRAFT_572900 [Cadophora sp. DSE1049]
MPPSINNDRSTQYFYQPQASHANYDHRPPSRTASYNPLSPDSPPDSPPQHTSQSRNISLSPKDTQYPKSDSEKEKPISFPLIDAEEAQVRDWLRSWFEKKTLPIPQAALIKVAWNGQDLHGTNTAEELIADIVRWCIDYSYSRRICSEILKMRASKAKKDTPAVGGQIVLWVLALLIFIGLSYAAWLFQGAEEVLRHGK